MQWKVGTYVYNALKRAQDRGDRGSNERKLLQEAGLANHNGEELLMDLHELQNQESVDVVRISVRG
jgi:hypothetical protein